MILFFKFRHLWAASITTFWSLSGFVLSSRIKLSYLNREREQRAVIFNIIVHAAFHDTLLFLISFTRWTDLNNHKLNLPFKTTGRFFQHLTIKKHDNWCRNLIRQIPKCSWSQAPLFYHSYKHSGFVWEFPKGVAITFA